MKITASKRFLHDQLGRVEKGAEIEVTPAQLRQLQGFGWVKEAKEVKEYETKVVHQEPVKPARKAK